MSEGPAPGSVDDVRDRLRRLGYLDSGLDRFVLGGTAAAAPARASARVALRLGVAGGVLFGTALALIATTLEPSLLRAPGDLAVLAGYLVVLLGAAVALTAFVAGWFLARASRTRALPPGLSRNVGLALALLALAYFALWWRSHALGASWLLQVTALAIALGLGLLLGRFGALAAVAVLSAAGAPELPRAPVTRRHLVPLIAAAVALFAAGVAAAAWSTPGARPAAPFAVVSTGLRVRVVAVDGLSGPLATDMMARGAMPNLAALMARSARVSVRPEPQAVPVIVWTTIATGRGPEAHGIVAPGGRRLAGMNTTVTVDEGSRLARAVASATDVLRLTREQPVTSALRSVKAFWNVASEKGLRVGVVNWWATWPADAVDGWVVTDRALFKLEKGGPPEREAVPAEIWPELQRLASGTAPASALAGLPTDVEGQWARAARIDSFHASAAAALRVRTPPDVEALYLPGLDILTTQLLSTEAVADVPQLGKRLAAITRYCTFLDGLIAEATSDASATQVVVLVTDPGRLARAAGPGAGGLLVGTGGPFRTGDAPSASERDVAPTVLHLLGLPVSEELDGHVVETALDPAFRAAHPVRRVSTYGTRQAPPATASSFDQDTMEQLRSLGYVH